MSNRTNTALSADKIIKGVYEKICQLPGTEVITLSHPVQAEIINDCDGRRNYMIYQEFCRLTVHDKQLALSHGKTCGSYPNDPYDSEIAAVRLIPPPRTSLKATEMTVNRLSNGYFRNTLIIALSSGALAFGQRINIFRRGLEVALHKPLAKFVAEELEQDRDRYNNKDLTPVIIRAKSYRSALVPYLTTAITKVLAGT